MIKTRIGLLVTLVVVLLAATVPGHVEAQTAAPSSPAPSATKAPDWPLLSQHESSYVPPVQVRSLQYLLDAHGAHLLVDGKFGPVTAAALRKFQKAHGLKATAVTYASTWLALIITVRYGSVGDAVRAVQDQVNFFNLRGTGYLAVDGVFGALTERGVKSLQHAWGIKVDGVVGRVTWRNLVSEYMSG